MFIFLPKKIFYSSERDFLTHLTIINSHIYSKSKSLPCINYHIFCYLFSPLFLSCLHPTASQPKGRGERLSCRRERCIGLDVRFCQPNENLRRRFQSTVEAVLNYKYLRMMLIVRRNFLYVIKKYTNSLYITDLTCYTHKNIIYISFSDIQEMSIKSNSIQRIFP